MKKSKIFLIMFMCFLLVLGPCYLYSWEYESEMTMDEIITELIQNEIESIGLSTASIADLQNSVKIIQEQGTPLEALETYTKNSTQKIDQLNEYDLNLQLQIGKSSDQISMLQTDSSELKTSMSEIFDSFESYKKEFQKEMTKTNLKHIGVEIGLAAIILLIIFVK